MVAVSVADAYSLPSVNRSDMSRALKNRFCRGSCSTCADGASDCQLAGRRRCGLTGQEGQQEEYPEPRFADE